MHETGRDLDELDEALLQSRSLSRDLLCNVTRHCARFSSMRQSGKAVALDRMIEAGAWTDAVIALIALELTHWSIRRIVWVDREWLCSLSRQPSLPIFLDEVAEASHPVLALAILRAFVAAGRKAAVTQQAAVSVPQVRSAPAFLLCCDNLS